MISHLTTFYRHPAGRATGLIFAATGLMFGTWAALIPYIKEKFGLDEAGLGLLLLCLPAGVLIMNPLSVPVMHRFGAVKTTLWSLVLAAWLFILPFSMPSVWLAGLSLFFAGMAFSSTNMAMNTCASLLEQRAGLRIFSTCHGLWSTGAMIGAALAGTAAGRGMAPVACIVAMVLLQLVIVSLSKAPLSGVPDDVHPVSKTAEKPSGFIMPNKALWTLIIISLCTNLTEGTMTDWSAVYMREVVGAPEVMTGYGFAVYAFFMAGGRFLGDELIARFGGKFILRTCGTIVFCGLLVVVFLHGAAAALTGFALVGAGVSLGAPVLYAAAARVPGLAKGAGLATMNTFAMAGFLGGPAFIGFLAKAFSLPAAFGMVALFSLLWIWKAGKIT